MHIKNHMVFNLRKRNRKPIKQIRQPRPKFLRHIRRPRRRALDASSVEHVDSDAPALGDDFSEEIHRVRSRYFISASNIQLIIFRRIFEIMYTPNTRARGRRTLYAVPRGRFEARGHNTSAEQLQSYATMFQTQAQQATPDVNNWS